MMNSKIPPLVVTLLAIVTMVPTAAAAGAAEFDNGTAMSGIERITFMSFIGIGLMFLATAFFLFMERNDVARRHRPVVGISVMIVGIAGVQYLLMQDVFATEPGALPTDFRYADWITTVPLMAVSFAVLAGKESHTERRLFSLPGMSVPGIIIVGSLFMMASGYLGQVELDQALAAGVDPNPIHWYFFFQGCVGYLTVFMIVGTPFTGAYGIDDDKIKDPAIAETMARLRRLVSIGWLIYPAGYVIGALELGGVDGAAAMMLTYNLADLVNKLAFVIIILVGCRATEEAMQIYNGQEPTIKVAAPEGSVQDTPSSSALLELAALSQQATESPDLSGEF